MYKLYNIEGEEEILPVATASNYISKKEYDKEMKKYSDKIDSLNALVIKLESNMKKLFDLTKDYEEENKALKKENETNMEKLKKFDVYEDKYPEQTLEIFSFIDAYLIPAKTFILEEQINRSYGRENLIVAFNNINAYITNNGSIILNNNNNIPLTIKKIYIFSIRCLAFEIEGSNMILSRRMNNVVFNGQNHIKNYEIFILESVDLFNLKYIKEKSKKFFVNFDNAITLTIRSHVPTDNLSIIIPINNSKIFFNKDYFKHYYNSKKH